jgi:hypothetical protein
MAEMKNIRKNEWALIVLSASILAVANSVPCMAQAGYPNFGFRSYCNTGYRNCNNGGMAGYTTNNSFNSGLSSMSRTYNGATYSTQRSTAAAQDLAKEVSTIWSSITGGVFNHPQQSMAQTQQNLSQPATTMNGMLPQVSKQEMLRIFLEGGTPQTSGGYSSEQQGISSSANSTAYSNYQTATNEEIKARNAEQRVRYTDRDQWSRKNDASQAEYAANNANYAAQRAESAAENGDSQARGYANLAREAANRAREDANQARYNADTMH